MFTKIMQELQGSYIVDTATGHPLEVKRAFANIAAGQTDASIVAAVAGKKIRIVALDEQCGDVATTITYNSKGSGAGVAISALHANAANGGRVKDLRPAGYYQTSTGEGFTATTGAGSATGVEVLYVEVPA